MTTTDISLSLAERRVKTYRDFDAELLSRHAEAMNCRDCEEFLQKGIDAFRWLRQADEIIRQAAKDKIEIPEHAVQLLRKLYEDWRLPCDRAEKMVTEQERACFTIKNLAEFREACAYVNRQLQMYDAYDAIDDAINGVGFTGDFWNEAAALRQMGST